MIIDYNNQYPYAQQEPKKQKNFLNIRKYMHDFNDRTRPHFNDAWFERDDNALIKGMEYIINACQRDKHFTLRVLSYRVERGYREVRNILQDYYSKKTKNGKKQENIYDFINLRDSEIMLLIVKYYIKINIDPANIRIDPKTKQPEQTEGEEDVLIILPKYVNKYYFYIQGNYYAPMFQIVDGSTYNNRTSTSRVQTVTFKTNFMSIKMYREFYQIHDIGTKENINCALYTTYIFSKKCDTIKYVLSRYNYYGALEFLELWYADIKLGLEVRNPEIYYNFKCKDKTTIVSVYKYAFNDDLVVQSFIMTMIRGVYKYNTWDDIFNPRFWAKSLGGDFMYPSVEKGIAVFDSIESVYDTDIKDTIHLPDEDKSTVYTILRWMMREFGALRQKDNLDISTKRIRMADSYLPAIYAIKLSKAIYNISDRGKSVKYIDVKRAVNINPNYLLSQLNSSKLTNYVDLVNDNDAETALSYTYKGVSGLGDTGAGTAVPIIYRSIHPSHLGRVDLDASSASDPGMSGIIAPMADEYNYSFTDYEEPNSRKDIVKETIKKFYEENNIIPLMHFDKKLPLSYDYIKDELAEEVISTFNRSTPLFTDINGKIDYTLNETMPYVKIDNEKIVPHYYIRDDDVPFNEGEEINGNSED